MKEIHLMIRGMLLIAVSWLGLHTMAIAQPPELPGPEKEHQWLKRFVGEWQTHSEGKMGPDVPPMECEGTMSSRMIGELWVINEMKGEAMGTPMVGIQTIGYDPERKKYIGTWVDSMANHLWRYDGTLDESGKRLTLEADGPNFMAGGEMTKFRDSYEFKSDDEILVTSSMLGEDGDWVTFMTGTSKRVK